MEGRIPKSIKKKLADIVYQAHERALRKELTKLGDAFESWRRGDINSFDLEELIHNYHNGAARDIYKRFTYSPSELPMLAAFVIGSGLVKEDEVEAEVLPHLGNRLAFYRAER